MAEFEDAWVTHDHLPERVDRIAVAQLRALRSKIHGQEWCTGDRRRTGTLPFSDVPVVERLRAAVERYNFALLNFYNSDLVVMGGA